MRGLILVAQWPERSFADERPGPPIFWVPLRGGPWCPVHEAWFWDRELRLWFVMCSDPAAMTDVARGRVGFYCANTREQLRALREQWRGYLCSRS